jgi:hypothetical protein
MARGIGGISSILQANIAAERAPETPGLTADSRLSLVPAEYAPRFSEPPQPETARTAELTVDTVIEELERRLEFQFLRMYGTSGG